MPVYRETLDDPRRHGPHQGPARLHHQRAARRSRARRRRRAAALDLAKVDLASTLGDRHHRAPVLFVPPSMPASTCWRRCRRRASRWRWSSTNMAAPTGWSRIEDLVEMVVGDIEDEHDDDEAPMITAGPTARYRRRAHHARGGRGDVGTDLAHRGARARTSTRSAAWSFALAGPRAGPGRAGQPSRRARVRGARRRSAPHQAPAHRPRQPPERPPPAERRRCAARRELDLCAPPAARFGGPPARRQIRPAADARPMLSAPRPIWQPCRGWRCAARRRWRRLGAAAAVPCLAGAVGHLPGLVWLIDGVRRGQPARAAVSPASTRLVVRLRLFPRRPLVGRRAFLVDVPSSPG